MQQLSFASVFLLVCLMGFASVEAIPTRARRQLQANSGMVTVPLKRLHANSDGHPQILLQQHINRASKRLARMTGREQPSDLALRSELHKRMFLLESGPGSRSSASAATIEGSNFSKRHYRTGMAAVQGNKHHGNGTTGAGASNATVTPGNGEMNGNGTMSGNGTISGVTAAGNGTNAGVSPLDIQAATNGGLTPANPPTTNNSLGLSIEADDIGYIATIQIGTPPRNFNLLMDSGSADFWVGGENCQSQQGDCGNHTFLGTQSSSSFVQSNQQFQVTYGSGEVQGVLCQDNVNIAGLALNNHTFGVASEESIQFASSSVSFDGLMGLAQSILSEQKVLTPVESLASNGLIQSPITSFKISRLADQLNDGEVTFGGLDASKFVASSLVTIPNVNTQGFWEGAIDAVTIDGADTGLSGRTAILDTGTTLILVPPQDAQQVMQGLGGTCDTQHNASLALSFGNASFSIDPRDIAVLPVDLNNPTGDCTAGIQPQQVGTATEWLVGDVFLKNAYFSTDVSKNQISLAKLTTP
ncbi:acid protease [Melanogaster broomeanus]|nr:acid protease [Melanogaster broomeanus]